VVHPKGSRDFPGLLPRLHVFYLCLRGRKNWVYYEKIWGVIMLIGFGRYFFYVIWHIKAVILMLVALIAAGAAALSFVEKMPFGDTLYFAFVTGLTIGYGDIVVKTPLGRLVALLIGFNGILFTGLMVAVLVLAVRESYEESKDID
jgi:hypothetical protein